MSVRITDFAFPQGIINDIALAQGNNTPLAFAQAPIAINSSALVMSKAILHLPQIMFDSIIYGIVVQNIGTNIATGVIVEDNAVSHVSFTNATTTTGTIVALTPSIVRVVVGDMVPGQIATVYVVGTIA
ncbi:hypothetical protein ACJDT4_03860 [Clostridium neuense]|uniref:DUF11 domain-containing protein n=1 Tax=Clostridium neuense TaxID=1728934 RepID=A0ABW8TCT8_9CLOT